MRINKRLVDKGSGLHWGWKKLVFYTTKWYSLPALNTCLYAAVLEVLFYSISHHWHESEFVSINLWVGHILLVSYTLVEWAYRIDTKKYWNNGNSPYHNLKSHKLGIYVPRRVKNG